MSLTRKVSHDLKSLNVYFTVPMIFFLILYSYFALPVLLLYDNTRHHHHYHRHHHYYSYGNCSFFFSFFASCSFVFAFYVRTCLSLEIPILSIDCLSFFDVANVYCYV